MRSVDFWFAVAVMLKVHTQYALQSSVYTHDMIYDEQQQILFFFKAETGQLTVLVE